MGSHLIGIRLARILVLFGLFVHRLGYGTVYARRRVRFPYRPQKKLKKLVQILEIFKNFLIFIIKEVRI